MRCGEDVSLFYVLKWVGAPKRGAKALMLSRSMW